MAASAVDEPETPPMSVDMTTLVWAIPPYMWRVTIAASPRSLSVIPHRFIRFPANMNSGTASRLTLCIWDSASCAI